MNSYKELALYDMKPPKANYEFELWQPLLTKQKNANEETREARKHEVAKQPSVSISAFLEVDLWNRVEREFQQVCEKCIKHYSTPLPGVGKNT